MCSFYFENYQDLTLESIDMPAQQLARNHLFLFDRTIRSNKYPYCILRVLQECYTCIHCFAS